MLAWTEFLLYHLWVDAAVIAFLAMAVFLGAQRHRVAGFIRMDKPTADTEQPDPRSDAEAALQELGFIHCGDFRDAGMVPGVASAFNAYSSADHMHQAMVLQIQTQYEAFSVVEFSTELSPFGSISTNNSRQASFFWYPLHKSVVKAPWKHDVQALFELHLAFVDVARVNGYKPKVNQSADFARNLVANCRRDFERQVRRKIMVRVDPDSYRLTARGSLLGSHKVYLNFVYGFLGRWYRPTNETLCRRYERRLDRMRSTGYHPDPE